MAAGRTAPVERPGDAPQPGRPLRIGEAIAGLLSAGVLVMGVVLAALMLLAPHLISGTGLSAAGGPHWDRAAVHLVAGVAGEVAHVRRAGYPVRTRAALAAGAVLLSAAALWWSWWR